MSSRSVLLALVVVSVTLVFGVSAASASTIEVVEGTAVFTGAPGEANDVQMVAPFQVPATLRISDAGAPLTAGAGCTQIDAHSAFCAEDSSAPLPLEVATGDADDSVLLEDFYFRRISVAGGRGDDKLYVSSNRGTPAHLDGGAGDDDLTVNLQLGAEPVLRGGSGDDTLSILQAVGGFEYGEAGNDRLVYRGFTQGLNFPLVLDGGFGNDTYAFEWQFVPTAMVAGSGIDTLDESTADPRALGTLSFDLLSCPGCVNRVIGTAQADQITGDFRPQAILGADGDDVLDAGGGNDAIFGQAGDDTITSRDGKIDVVSCGAGSDTVVADRRDIVSRDCESVTRASPAPAAV
jgi:Ca2+-binding RTX toxin-like protein